MKRQMISRSCDKCTSHIQLGGHSYFVHTGGFVQTHHNSTFNIEKVELEHVGEI